MTAMSVFPDDMSPAADTSSTDRIDRALIALLRQDGRAPVTALAKRLGLSRSSVYARLERLERSGTICGYTVLLGEGYRRRRIGAHVLITCASRRSGAIGRRLAAMPAVTALHAISGAHDLVAIVEAEDVAALNLLIDEIGGVDGVTATSSSILLATTVQR